MNKTEQAIMYLQSRMRRLDFDFEKIEEKFMACETCKHTGRYGKYPCTRCLELSLASHHEPEGK